MDGMFLQTGRIFEPIRYPDGEILAFLERQPERIRAKDLESVKADDTARVQKPREERPSQKTSFPAGAATSGAGGTALTWGQCSGKGTVIGMSLLKVEQETIILFNEAEATASVYTHNAALQRVLLELCQTHPAQVQQTEDNRHGGLTFELPKKVGENHTAAGTLRSTETSLDEMNQRNRERRQST